MELPNAGTEALRGPPLWWCAGLGSYVANELALEFSLLPPRWHGQGRVLLQRAAIISLTVT